LKRVIVASGERVAMRETLSEALLALIAMDSSATDTPEVEAGEPSEPIEAEPTPESGDVADETPTRQSSDLSQTIESLVQEANDRFEAAQEAQRAGDWSTYGRELEALQTILQQLMDRTQ